MPPARSVLSSLVHLEADVGLLQGEMQLLPTKYNIQRS